MNNPISITFDYIEKQYPGIRNPRPVLEFISFVVLTVITASFIVGAK